MQCAQCGSDNRSERRYCSGCGSLLTAACASCGFHNGVGEKFCGGCAAAIPTTSSRPAPVLETERKYVTVLFADIRGSLELIADRDPEEAQAVIDPVLERLVRSASEFGGTVNHTIGDGIMALFGAPVAYEDHALRAASAALAMLQAVRALVREPDWRFDTQVMLRVGLNSGEVVMRSSISGLPSDYSAVGETAHVASRVEKLAQPGTIALTGQTLKLLAGRVDVAPLGASAVKGLAHPIELYRLLGLRAANTRIRGGPDRPLSRFVGRQLELDLLAEALSKARSGHGQLLAVVGEPGVGKSRLFLEFTHSAEVAGCLVLECGSEAFGPTSPMVPVVELARAYLHVERHDDPAIIAERLQHRLEHVDDEDGGEIAAAFQALLLPEHDSPARRMGSAAERQYRIVNGITKALLHESRRQPLLVVIEDLHWIDAASRSFLDAILDQLRESNIVVLVSYRPDYQPDWGQRSYAQLRLERLSSIETDILLENLLGPDQSLVALKRDLELQTDGNALFLEESVQALVEAQILVGGPGAYRLATRRQEYRVPASVQAVLAARIDRLPPDERRVLHCAAVIGRRVSHDLLAAIAEVQPQVLDRAAERLRAAEFLYEARRYPTREYVFKHALTHEVAYTTLPLERRRRLHAQIFEALRAASPGGGRPEPLAYHAFRAELWEKALTYLRSAAAIAIASSADAAAIQYLEQALTALSHLPEEAATLQLAVDVRLELRNALMPLGDRARIFRTLVEAEALARRLGDHGRLGWVCGYLTPYLWGLGEYGRALMTGRQALDTAQQQGDAALKVIANRYLGHVHFAVGDYRQAVQQLQESLSSLQEGVIEQHFHLPYKSSIATSAWLASSLSELGRFTEAIELGRQGVADGEASGHAYSITAASCGLGIALLRQGDPAQAIPVVERAAALTRSGDFAALSAWITAMLGSAYALVGKLDEALLLLEEGAARMAAMQVRISEASVIAALGETCLLSGQRAKAVTHAEHALRIARDRQERGYEAWALRLVGEIAAAGGEAETGAAAAAFGEAMAITEVLGMRPLHAHCSLGLGRIHRRAGALEVARPHLATALRLYREMGMRHWLPQAEAAAEGLVGAA